MLKKKKILQEESVTVKSSVGPILQIQKGEV